MGVLMKLRTLFTLAVVASLATACTAIIGLEDLPPAPKYDAGSSSTPPPSAPSDAGAGG